MDSLPSIRLMGVDVHRLRQRDVVDAIDASIARGEGGWVLTPNLDILRRLTRDAEFARLCEGVTLRVADGMPLIWASRLARTPLPERVAGSDLIWTLSERAASRGHTLFLLGGDPGTAEEAARVLSARYPGLQVVGTACPPFGFERDESYLASLEAMLVSLAPDVVFVGLGSPKQERLIERLRLVAPAAWYLGIGISFSFVCGDVRRAPHWMRVLGLEWVHRLVQEPGRLAKRYLVDGLPFVALLLASSTLQGLGMRAGDRNGAPANGAPGRYRKAG
jgi:N-acetylglucosaminyldiphosphoundecaprenol N-acetyl-beta-D-mannosaminyltransferase